MEFHSVLLIIVAATLATASTVVELTNGNWDKITKRKAIFVKFCTKSCHHCKSMHIAWERLGDAWVDDEGVVIGRVDCKKETIICENFDILGTPTLLYGDPYNLKEYAGEKDYLSLNAFAKEELVSICSPDNMNPCSALEKEQIGKWMAMTTDEIQEMIDGVKEMEENAHKEFDVEMAKMQVQYDELNNEFVLTKAKLMREIELLKEMRAAITFLV